MSDKMSYDEAVGHYMKWTEKFSRQSSTPCNAASEFLDMSKEFEDMSWCWKLENINGPIAIVESDATVWCWDSLIEEAELFEAEQC